MSKPTVFFSHSTKDKDALVRLKDLFLEKTGGAIDVFLSSDGQSIPLGRNWVYSVEEGLNRAKMMIVFVSPNSLKSNWLYFESGYAYSKGLRVVPVGFGGVDLAALMPPLSLLQGFNITSKDGLDNLIVLANDQFKHSHGNHFTAEEYQEVLSLGESLANATFGSLGESIREIYLEVATGSGVDPMVNIGQRLSTKGIPWQKGKYGLVFDGVSIEFRRDREEVILTFRIDPLTFHVSSPVLEEIIRTVRVGGIAGIWFVFEFSGRVAIEKENHRISSRLYGTDAHLDADAGFLYHELAFEIGCVCDGLSITMKTDAIPLARIRELLNLLFAKHVLRLISP